MTWKLFLDDIRNPPDDSWVVAQSCYEAVALVREKGFPHTISFDHDLGDEEDDTGKDFANWLINRDMDIHTMPDDFTYYVHSANPCGAANIRGLLDGYMKFKKKK